MSTPTPNFDVAAFNADVRGWGTGWRAALRGQVAALNIHRTGALQRMLSIRYRTEHNQVYAVGAQFPRYAVFVEKGAGKGYGGKKGSRWRTQGKPRRTNPESLGKMGTGNRPAKRWFNPITEARVQDLGNIVAKHYGNAAINSIGIK